MKQKAVRLLGLYFLVDGLSTLLFGRGFVRLFRFGSRASPYRKGIEWLLRLPPWQLRSAGAAEAALGLAVLGRAPLQVHSIYQNIADRYATIDPGWRDKFYAQAHQAFDRSLTQYLPEGGRVLDLGSGLGANLARLSALKLPFSTYTGVDFSDAMLARATAKYSQIPNVQFEQLNLLLDPLPEGPFDLITATWVFEHLSDPVKVARKAWDKLKPGGHILLLFGVKDDSWYSLLIDRIYRFFSARLISNEEICHFPGKYSVERFWGPFGALALVVLNKPSGVEQERRQS